jgi:translation initiation factor 1A
MDGFCQLYFVDFNQCCFIIDKNTLEVTSKFLICRFNASAQRCEPVALHHTSNNIYKSILSNLNMQKYKDKSKKNSFVPGGFQQPTEVTRVPLPRDKQVLGILEQRLGANHMLIKCFDGKSRNCRVPGRLKRKLWLREGDVVLVEPWELGGDERGDLLLKYSLAQVEWLRKKGFLKTQGEL